MSSENRVVKDTIFERLNVCVLCLSPHGWGGQGRWVTQRMGVGSPQTETGPNGTGTIGLESGPAGPSPTEVSGSVSGGRVGGRGSGQRRLGHS